MTGQPLRDTPVAIIGGRNARYGLLIRFPQRKADVFPEASGSDMMAEKWLAFSERALHEILVPPGWAISYMGYDCFLRHRD